jgi:hypothetical protein
MKTFAALSVEDRALYWRNYSNRAGMPEFIAEKDFWVCWLLGRIFATPQLGAECVFKGGTSLSKVFQAIDRFSEDIDLGLSPASLGWNEADLDDAPSATQRQKRTKQLQTDCAAAVERRFMPELEAVVAACLGHCPGTGRWLHFDLLERVRIHKARFFASSWANYDTAVPGTLRFVPPKARLAELRRDYAAMEPMFLSPPPHFDEVLTTLREAEKAINAKQS